jgi:hypothetical protein
LNTAVRSASGKETSTGSVFDVDEVLSVLAAGTKARREAVER